MNNDISIIIVNYNSHLYIESCLNSLVSNTKELNYEIIIVDNNSPDRAITNLKNKFSNIELLLLNNNIGFGSACNYGAINSNGKYLVFVNPDTVFLDNCLKEMFEFMENTKYATVCSPSFVNVDGNQGYVYNIFPDVLWEFYDFFGKGYNYRIKKLEQRLNRYAISMKQMKIDWATAACLMIRKKCFNEVGGFDKDYFLYYEDVDLQKRISNSGGKVYCLPYLKVVHVANTSTKADRDDTVYYMNMYISKLIYYKKNCSIVKYGFVRYLHLTGFFLRIIALKIRNRYSESKDLKGKQYKKIIKYYKEGIE